ncbi:MAG: hypothetical protein LBS69_03780 [Prevotellaceae bacterium]|jgi:hypothetical protein|nr:hypothetical protein [Prevotellaceae bacterium]
MKKIINTLKITAILLILAGMIVACGKEKEDISCTTCDNKEIIMVLDDEPVHIKEITFPATDVFGFFVFELDIQYNGVNSKFIVPCNKIPDKYHIDGLSVKISGNITNCIHRIYDYLPSTDIAEPFTYEYNIFELKSIR